jgi:thiol-disulfide isomerase/thioredoxin
MATSETRALDQSTMSKLTNLLLTLVVFIICCGSLPAKEQVFKLQPFSNDTFLALKKEKLAERWLMVLWSLDCSACFKELKLIQVLQSANKSKKLNVVFINADDNDEIEFERKQVLAVYNMLDFENFYFVDGEADKSRYQIDSSWYGELPRSYFVDEKGAFHGKSGLLDEALIKEWLLD